MDTGRRRILWADDEIDLLRPHQLFLAERGYDVTPVNNGRDAVRLVSQELFDVVLLDEMMPGLDGLSTLEQIKALNPSTPVIMITKNEEEHLMDEAIGRRIDDYLTKPVNPSQILSACKKILDARQIRQAQLGQTYVARAAEIEAMLGRASSWRTWIDLHRQLCDWELEVAPLGDPGLLRMIADQRREANRAFAGFIESSFASWVDNEADSPPLSVDVVSDFVVPLLEAGRRVFLIVVDCLRLDHWMAMEPLLSGLYDIRRSYHYSILPSATPYARNAIFCGLFPRDIAARHGDIWQGADTDDASLNRFEHRFLDEQLAEMRAAPKAGTQYIKVMDPAEGQNLARRVASLAKAPLVAVVYNFLDMLLHGRSHSELLREIAPDERAFRSLVRSWFDHSTLLEALREIARTDAAVVLTTDHGAVYSSRATVVYGDRSTSPNLRYKRGRSLRCNEREALLVDDPTRFGLPRGGLGTNFVFAREDYYFVYPTHQNEYERQFRDSFQHGGISLEEMILPVALMDPR